MKCSHCLNSFFDEKSGRQFPSDSEYSWFLVSRICPSCRRPILLLDKRTLQGSFLEEIFCYPKTISRAILSPDIPEKFSKDYKEACQVLADSPKARAALSRCCLQHLLREKAGVKPGKLANEIQQVLDEEKLPSHILESLDAVRSIGNFTVHPLKDTSTGEIIAMEFGEVEWNLDVLEALFDFFFVQPAITKRKRDALNQKLRDAGKPEMKQ